jgi:tRNA dimethylallyltransferase
MFDAGLIDEVRALRARGDLHTDLPAVRAVGYRQVWDHLAGQTDLADCREKVLAATRQLAKRQLTWLRSWPDLTWVLTDHAGRVVQNATQPVESVLGRKTPTPEASGRLWKGRILDHLRNF